MHSYCMFWIENKKIRYTPANPSFFFYKNVGLDGVCFSRTCFPDDFTVYAVDAKTVN